MSKFYLKIILPSILAIVLFVVAIFFFIIPNFQKNIMKGKRETIKELTNSAWSILSKYDQEVKNGTLSLNEAQKTAISEIEHLRYGDENKDYFWITDMYPHMVVHPYRHDLDGKDLSNFTDPHGKKLFVEFVETVKQSGSGYVDYMWQWKDDSTHIVPKLSYVKAFKPWGWVIGTGIYIEDVKKEIQKLTHKLLYISVGITLLIALLLLFISQQSLRIERKRIRAELDLHESKEKYRTLVEAATEGLIMMIDGKISYSNSVITSITGYTHEELLGLPIKDIISDNNNKDLISVFNKNFIREGSYELFLKKKNGLAEVLLTSSKADFYNRTVNIIIIKDITLDKSQNVSGQEFQKIITKLDLGFFRAKIDARGKFIFANETAIKILGYDSYEDLSKLNLLDILAQDSQRKIIRYELLKNGFVKNNQVQIIKKNGNYGMIAVSLVVYKNDNDGVPLCDGIIEDISLKINEQNETEKLITELQSGAYFFTNGIESFIKPIATIDADATISRVFKTLESKSTDYVLLTNSEGNSIGIVTAHDIQTRVLYLNLSLENPAYLIMSAPLISVNQDALISDAINICERKRIHHLLIRNLSGENVGIIHTDDIYKSLKNNLSFLLKSIDSANSVTALKLAYKTLQMLVKPLIKNDISIEFITKTTSTFSDAVIKRLIELVQDEIGMAPCDFCFICMGSEGRQEESLLTDQDNAIVIEDLNEIELAKAQTYFAKLADKVCTHLNEIGYAFCKGNVMAKNPKWCQPASNWGKYFTEWTSNPEPQNLLDGSIFFDIRKVYGSDALIDRLLSKINHLIKNQPLFLYYMANNACASKPPQIFSINIISDKSADTIDLKVAVNILIMFARTYALQNQVEYTNTISRLNALKSKRIISDKLLDEILFSYQFLMKIRLRNQVNLAESNLPLSNTLQLKNLNEIELSFLKKVLSQLSMYQHQLATDFRVKS